MSAALFLLGAAAANASAAAANDAAQAAACHAFMPTFNAQAASIDQMHYYAACVARLYPAAHTYSLGWGAKSAIAFALFSAAFGAVSGWRHGKQDDDRVVGAITSAFGCFLLACAVDLFVFGCVVVLS